MIVLFKVVRNQRTNHLVNVSCRYVNKYFHLELSKAFLLSERLNNQTRPVTNELLKNSPGILAYVIRVNGRVVGLPSAVKSQVFSRPYHMRFSQLLSLKGTCFEPSHVSLVGRKILSRFERIRSIIPSNRPLRSPTFPYRSLSISQFFNLNTT